jgi:2-polyprenyl-3-methyl-5-hydroxy-6-metoxy-1,4-benzoquinol methylase
MVPTGCRILDIGCWDGSMGAYLIKARQATVDGVELNAGMARRAALAYREVHSGPIEALLSGLIRARAGQYDALLLLDVLEHLVEPGRILEELRALVEPGGLVVVSLPNVAHWSVRKALLFGRWNYRDYGLMDRTHLRFYTLKTGRLLIEDAGWRITHSLWSIGQPPLLRLPENALDTLGRWPTLFAVQQLYVATVS